jgi:hypothetical protein
MTLSQAQPSSLRDKTRLHHLHHVWKNYQKAIDRSSGSQAVIFSNYHQIWSLKVLKDF